MAYQKLLKCGPKLSVAIRDRLNELAELCLSEGLISDDNASEVRNGYNPAPDRASKLLEILRNRVKIDSKSYDVFVNALKKSDSDYGHILKILGEEPPPPPAEPVSLPAKPVSPPSVQQSLSSAGPPPQQPSAQQPTPSIPPGTLSMTMLSFQRHVELDVLQAHNADLSQVLSIDPDQFGSLLVQCGFAAHPTISNIVGTLGVSNYQKATKLLNIVDSRIRTVSSREAARNLFNTFVQIVAYPMGQRHVAEALVTTCKSKDPSYESPLQATANVVPVQSPVSSSISTGSIPGPSLSSGSSLQGTAQSATNVGPVSRPTQPVVAAPAPVQFVPPPQQMIHVYTPHVQYHPPQPHGAGHHGPVAASVQQIPANDPILDASPTLAKLTMMKSASGQKTQIIKKMAAHWYDLGILLDFDGSGNQLDIIKKKHQGDPEECCQAMFQHWVKGNGKQPHTWRTLIELIDDSDQEVLAKEILNTLLSSR